MAIKGATEKEQIIEKILETFEGSFKYDKELRIPIGDVQIKVSLTCAKENVNVAAGASEVPSAPSNAAPAAPEPSEEEINQVNSLMVKLGL